MGVALARCNLKSCALQPLDPDDWSGAHWQQMGLSVSLDTALAQLGNPANDEMLIR